MKIAQVVLGPAGTGKTTYCHTLQQHCDNSRRMAHVMNLDPAAVDLPYTPSIDIRELISLEDAMEELKFGPNGGLVYCLEFLIENLEWLTDSLGDYADDYLIIDCPGQIELYSHMSAMSTILNTLSDLGYYMCTVYLLDSTFVSDPAKFIAGSLSALSAMIRLEKTHINVLTKMDILKEARRQQKSEMLQYRKKSKTARNEDDQDSVLRGDDNDDDEEDDEEDESRYVQAENDDNDDEDVDDKRVGPLKKAPNNKMKKGRGATAADDDDVLDEEEREDIEIQHELEKYLMVDMDQLSHDLDDTMPLPLQKLNHALGGLLDEFGLVQFVPLDITSTYSIQSLMHRIDMATQFGEDEDVRIPKEDEDADGDGDDE